MRIVLIGDLHFFSLLPWPWQLLGKRTLGQMNLWFHRRFKFKMSRVAALVERIHALKPDLLLFSGDLTTTALPSEFRIARDALAPLLKAYPALIVPGNHDRYTFTAARHKRLEHFFPDHTAGQYPHLRPLDENLFLIALDPTKPNLWGDRGRLGVKQLDGLRGMLSGLPPGAGVIVLCHYTLGVPAGQRAEASGHGMTDETELRDILGRCGREVLYLHGHVHTPFCWRLPQAPNVVAVNAGAPLMHDGRWLNGQGFWEIEKRGQTPFSWALTHHGLDRAGLWVAEPAEIPAEPGEAVTFM